MGASAFPLGTDTRAALAALGEHRARSLVTAAAALAVHYADHARTSRFVLDGTDFAVAVEPDEPADKLGARAVADPVPASEEAGTAADFRLTPAAHEVRVEHPDEVSARAAARLWATVLRGVLRDPGQPVRGYPVLDAVERERVVRRFNDTARDFPADLTLHELLRRQARRTPDAVAVSTDSATLTYRELDERSDRLAGYLLSRPGMDSRIVAVLAERCLEMPVALFGILKAGCAYLPLDPRAPALRLRELTGRSGAALVLYAGEAPADLGVPAVDLHDPGLYPEPDAPVSAAVRSGPRDLAYVIYTSGSTGTPKGVMVEHRSVVNRLVWMQREHPIGPGDTLLQKTPTIFDVSVWELFWWTLTGSRMHLLAPGMERFPLALAQTAEREGITALHFVPSLLGPFLAHLRDTGGAARLGALRRVFASGESLPPALVTEFGEVFGDAATLVNLYGPTEATVDVSGYVCPRVPGPGRVPIGAPIDNVRFHVMRYGQALPVGAVGTLHVAGECVARGYLGDPELTAIRFVPEYGSATGRMYDTGDIVRWLPSGRLDFLGRADSQVKIRGIRIDLTEIENVLLGAPGVRECAVALDRPSPAVAVLRACVVGEGLTRAALRDHAGERLPASMVPTGYETYDALPRTGSGKVDRRPLGDPAYVREHGRRL